MSAELNSEEVRVGIFSWIVSMKRLLPGYFWPILIFSLVSNLLLLVSPLYMLQVYDRILTSGSKDTLIWITIIAVFLMFIYAAAETARRHMCALAAEKIEGQIAESVFSNFENNKEAGEKLPDDLRVLSRIRGFFRNQAILPFFDLPFSPLFLLVMFLIHPIIGIIGLIGGIILFIVAIAAEFSTRNTNKIANSASSQAFLLATGLSRQRSAIVSMGLTKGATEKWRMTKDQFKAETLKASERENGFSSITRAGRQTLQILILGAGGALAISQQVSPGAIVAGSIIMSRTLAPIDQMVGNWRGITAAKMAWHRLEDIMAGAKDVIEDFTPLPRPDAHLAMQRLCVAAPGMREPLIRPFALELNGGQLTALMGPNGSGKSSLLQTITGAWEPHSGHVVLGGRDLHAWIAEDRGQYIGYVPQNIELLPGTIAENVCRMSGAEPEQIFAAAKLAGAHEMILALPQGYETPIGMPGTQKLSAGQRQLIGLARALFGNPVLIVLDEPTANLDPEKSREITQNLVKIARMDRIIIAATHDNNLIAATQNIMAIKDGTLMTADTKKYLEAMSAKTRPANVIQPLRPSAQGGPTG